VAVGGCFALRSRSPYESVRSWVGMSHAILSPHFDDAVLSCWHSLEARAEVTVVNVFTASPPSGTPPPWWDRATGATDPVERMRERREEDAAALALVGRSSVELGLLDDQYRKADTSVHDVVGRLRLAVDPQAILHAPGAFDGHPDHVLVRDAALELGRLGRPVVLYADLPHAILRGWPTWLSRDHKASGPEVAAEWSRVLAATGLPAENLVRRVHALDAQARSRKLRAIAAYHTQRAALDRLAFLPLEDPRTLAWEVSWEIPPSALRGADELIGEATVADSPCEPLDDQV
jgi:LmbE family N-acetylglucosaminyl deacetylase